MTFVGFSSNERRNVVFCKQNKGGRKMANVIAWDTERFSQLQIQIERAVETVQTQKERVESLSQEAQDGWQSDAGREYADVLDSDLEKLDEVSGDLEELLKILGSVINFYNEGEENVYKGIAEILNVTE